MKIATRKNRGVKLLSSLVVSGVLLTGFTQSSYALSAVVYGASVQTYASETAINVRDWARDNKSAEAQFKDASRGTRTTLKLKTSGYGDAKYKDGYSYIYQVRACTVNGNWFSSNTCSKWES